MDSTGEAKRENKTFVIRDKTRANGNDEIDADFKDNIGAYKESCVLGKSRRENGESCSRQVKFNPPEISGKSPVVGASFSGHTASHSPPADGPSPVR